MQKVIDYLQSIIDRNQDENEALEVLRAAQRLICYQSEGLEKINSSYALLLNGIYVKMDLYKPCVIPISDEKFEEVLSGVSDDHPSWA